MRACRHTDGVGELSLWKQEALYEAALVEAHRQVVGLDELAALAAGLDDPGDQLRAMLSRFVGLSTSAGTPWGFMLMLREVLSPSKAIPALIEKAVRPKAAFLLKVIGEVLGLDPATPVVQRAVMFTVLPCIAMMIAPKQMQSALLPAVAKDKDALAEDFVRFVLAGLDAIALAHRSEAVNPALQTASSTGVASMTVARIIASTFRGAGRARLGRYTASPLAIV